MVSSVPSHPHTPTPSLLTESLSGWLPSTHHSIHQSAHEQSHICCQGNCLIHTQDISLHFTFTVYTHTSPTLTSHTHTQVPPSHLTHTHKSHPHISHTHTSPTLTSHTLIGPTLTSYTHKSHPHISHTHRIQRFLQTSILKMSHSKFLPTLIMCKLCDLLLIL